LGKPETKKISGRMASAWRRHERRWKNNRYVYAVVSRRSRGISVGINVNPDKTCNFDCIYCQVNRNTPAAVRKVDLEILAQELDTILQEEKTGTLYGDAPFSALTPAERGVRDIAFSGDGEPSTFPHIEEAIRIAASARQKFGLNSTKLALLTNVAHLNKPAVCSALALLDENNGEIWAKLDAGTEDYFRLVNRPDVALQRVLDNLLEASRIRPLIIQSLWFLIRGAAPPAGEIEAYCSRLNSLLDAGGRLKALQLYTIARDPAEPYASPLPDDELDRIALEIGARVPAPVEVYYGV
jgi:wyosine [tRNA(Phe)-imidazoG37] synthetase (radical SAM superfamily)